MGGTLCMSSRDQMRSTEYKSESGYMHHIVYVSHFISQAIVSIATKQAS